MFAILIAVGRFARQQFRPNPDSRDMAWPRTYNRKNQQPGILRWAARWVCSVAGEKTVRIPCSGM